MQIYEFIRYAYANCTANLRPQRNWLRIRRVNDANLESQRSASTLYCMSNSPKLAHLK